MDSKNPVPGNGTLKTVSKDPLQMFHNMILELKLRLKDFKVNTNLGPGVLMHKLDWLIYEMQQFTGEHQTPDASRYALIIRFNELRYEPSLLYGSVDVNKHIYQDIEPLMRMIDEQFGKVEDVSDDWKFSSANCSLSYSTS
jgi:hypothetical protein